LTENRGDLVRGEYQEGPLSVLRRSRADDVPARRLYLGDRLQIPSSHGPLREPAEHRQLLLQRFAGDDAQPRRLVVLDADSGQAVDRLEEGREVSADVDVFVQLERVGADRRLNVRQPFGGYPVE